jgi:hypothetical protein
VSENTQKLKERAAGRAVEFVKPGMVVGLGHGSTTIFGGQCQWKLCLLAGVRKPYTLNP